MSQSDRRGTTGPSRYGFSDNANRVGKSYRKATSSTSAPSGLFIGIVQSDVDPQRMGRLKVYIPNYSRTNARASLPAASDGTDSAITCMPILPFFGSTDGSNDPDGYSQSYGMWMHPRVGDVVAVMFADSDSADAYYIGCVPKFNQNTQVPGVPVAPTSTEDFHLPVSEAPKNSTPGSQNPSKYGLSKNLKQTGLQKDSIRGGSSSGGRRESPSRVFGIKTPGDAPSGQIGHQFIMDDLPENQLIRLRTSAGNQILLSDSGNQIYISSAQGNSWIEISEDGKIDLYAGSDISIHAERDLNFHADRDFNLEVGRDCNFRTAENVKWTVGGDHDHHVTGNKKTKVDGEQHWYSGLVSKLTSLGNMDLSSSADMHIGSSGASHYSASGEIKMDSQVSIKSQSGATAPTQATAAVKVATVELPGAPTRGQISKAEGGAAKSYVAGRDQNFRAPQHEPWSPPSEWYEGQPSGPLQSVKLGPPASAPTFNRLGNEPSIPLLKGVHPDLVAVVERAREITTQVFVVTSAYRTPAKQEELIRRGYPAAKNDSRHLQGMAVDLEPVNSNGAGIPGKTTYAAVSLAMKTAAAELQIPIIWGGSFKTKDPVHYMLPRDKYPNGTNPAIVTS